jgi:hypothetical protein
MCALHHTVILRGVGCRKALAVGLGQKRKAEVASGADGASTAAGSAAGRSVKSKFLDSLVMGDGDSGSERSSGSEEDEDGNAGRQ